MPELNHSVSPGLTMLFLSVSTYRSYPADPVVALVGIRAVSVSFLKSTRTLILFHPLKMPSRLIFDLSWFSEYTLQSFLPSILHDMQQS
jgi:hypothetical protein